MLLIIVLIIFILLALFIIALMAVGLCIGIEYLMTYFIPTLGLNDALLPAAILATVPIAVIAGVVKFFISESVKNSPILLSGYDDEYELEPPIVTRKRSYRSKKN